jgi:S1-C subfamily serine protease
MVSIAMNSKLLPVHLRNSGLRASVLAAIILAGCGQAPVSDQGPAKDPVGTGSELRAELVASISQKVVRVQALGPDGNILASGTGFFIQSDGTVATCAHVITGADRISVSTLSGAEFKSPTVIATDERNDLALLRVAGADVVPFRKDPAIDPAVGSPIIVLGNPLGLDGTYTTGIISAVRNTGKGDESVLQISAPISPGVSGAPVVSMSGELIGMVGARAKGGENIGFAMPASLVWDLVAKAQVKHSPKDSRKVALASASKRYLPGKELSEDDDWNRGELPEAPGQRLAILRRLQDRYPGEAILQIETVRALHDDGDTVGAIGGCANILKHDPANRMALDLLLRICWRQEETLPFIRAAITADPLHFRAREALAAYELSSSSRQYLAGTMSARRAVETAPFHYPSVQMYADGVLKVQLEQSANGEGQIFPHHEALDLAAIEAMVGLRELIAAGIYFLAERTEDSLLAFLSLAEGKPEVSIPYLWELHRALGSSNEEMKKLDSTPAASRLRELSKAVLRDHPVVSEAYLLDYAAVRPKDGLLIEGASDMWKGTIGPAIFNPFDQWAMGWLLSGLHSAPESTTIRAECVGRWYTAYASYFAATKKGVQSYSEFMELGSGEVQIPVLFQFVMACEKERLQRALKELKSQKADIAEVDQALKTLANVPTRQESAQTVRSAIAGLKNKDEFWGFYGDEYARQLEIAFESAAR